MSGNEEVELTNMCMISDGKGNVLVQNKVGNSDWFGWNFPGGHVEKGEYITPSVIREIKEETGLDIEFPKICGIKDELCLKNITKKVPDICPGLFREILRKIKGKC